jgi:hypothetical protein
MSDLIREAELRLASCAERRAELEANLKEARELLEHYG